MIREKLVFGLTTLIVLLGVGLLFKYQILTKDFIKDNKDIITVIKDAITILAVVLGAFLTYFKFFAGQTFTPKADIDFDISIIKAPDSRLLHAVKVTVINKSSLTIWNPEAHIKIKRWGDKSNDSEEIITQFVQEQLFNNEKPYQAIIDPGEKISFNIWRKFDSDIWAVTYQAEISSSTGRKWQNMVTISNQITN